jgi:hypothetical protein
MGMKEIVYIETSVVSLLVAKTSAHVVVAGNQQVTRDWWRIQQSNFLCVTSEETLVEAARGNVEQAKLRMAAFADFPLLPASTEAAQLAEQFLLTGALPPAAKADALHLAVATLASVDYLLTWNCRHLANAQILRRLEREAVQAGWALPKVCTPLELMGEYPYGSEGGFNS